MAFFLKLRRESLRLKKKEFLFGHKSFLKCKYIEQRFAKIKIKYNENIVVFNSEIKYNKTINIRLNIIY